MRHHVSQVVSQSVRSAAAQLRVNSPGDHGGDQIAGFGRVQFVTAHHTKKADESLHTRMLEMLENKFFRRRFEVSEILPSCGKFFQQRTLLLNGNRHCIGFREHDVFHHRLPARPDIQKRRGVFLRESRDALRRALHVGKPAEIGLIEEMVHHAGVGPVIVNAKVF